jgi:NitT/TauT family transport system permease protein
MKIKERILPLATIVLIIALWYAVAAIYNVELILPKPTVAFRELVTALGENEFWAGVGNTMLRTLVAFLVAFIAALLLSLVSSQSKVFFKLFYPVVVLLRALPTISVIFICYIAVKGWYRAVIIAFLVIFPTLFSSFYTAFENCNGELADVGKVFGVSTKNKLLRFVIPSVWAFMYSDIVNTLSLSVKLIVAAEAVTVTVTTREAEATALRSLQLPQELPEQMQVLKRFHSTEKSTKKKTPEGVFF